MFENNVVPNNFMFAAIGFLCALLIWNYIGRYLQGMGVRLHYDDLQARVLYRIASLIHVFVLSGIIFAILVFLIIGPIKSLTDFRYVTF